MYRFIFHYIYLRAVHEWYVSIDPRTILLVLEITFFVVGCLVSPPFAYREACFLSPIKATLESIQ